MFDVLDADASKCLIACFTLGYEIKNNNYFSNKLKP